MGKTKLQSLTAQGTESEPSLVLASSFCLSYWRPQPNPFLQVSHTDVKWNRKNLICRSCRYHHHLSAWAVIPVSLAVFSSQSLSFFPLPPHTSVPPSSLSLPPSVHLWQSLQADRSLARRSGFIERRLLIFHFIERPGRRCSLPAPFLLHPICLHVWAAFLSQSLIA